MFTFSRSCAMRDADVCAAHLLDWLPQGRFYVSERRGEVAWEQDNQIAVLNIQTFHLIMVQSKRNLSTANTYEDKCAKGTACTRIVFPILIERLGFVPCLIVRFINQYAQNSPKKVSNFAMVSSFFPFHKESLMHNSLFIWWDWVMLWKLRDIMH